MKAIIILEDGGNEGTVDIDVNFGKQGIVRDSRAHYLAVLALRAISQKSNVTQVEDDSDEEA